LRRDVFDRLRDGRWGTVLLADGNVGLAATHPRLGVPVS